MMLSFDWRLFVLGFVVATTAAIAYGADGGKTGWLNVKEFGASGSDFRTTAATTAGSNEIVVKDAGDFKVGQGVTVSKCNVHYERCLLRTGMYERKPLGDTVELRGYDGSNNGWIVFVIDIDGAEPPTFRWSDDVGRTWKAARVPVTYDWQPLGAGVEIRFTKKIKWQPGQVITFDARDQLVTTIEKIEGNVFTLKDPAKTTVKDAVVRHEDTAALQAAVKQAVKEKRNVFFPVGHYRILRGMSVYNADDITLQGENAEHTLLDISEGFGSCIRLSGGKRVTVRNFSMVGGTGKEEGNPRQFRSAGGFNMWRMHMKPCNAVSIRGTEHVLVENVHASRMWCECFYAQGPGREGTKVPKQYTKSITYLRCTVKDCGFNAFNNNDMSESTSILYCRVEDINNCFWEGPGRFIRIIGNYARNTGVIAVGNMFHRYEHLHDLGIAQTIVANNVFEGTSVNRAAINVRHCANEVVIRDNLFINYGSNAINLDCSDKSDFSDDPKNPHKASYPAGKVTVTGNIIDLTYQGEKAQTRTGIQVGLSDVIVSDNQVYVRGECDPNVHGIQIKDPAVNVSVHDNLILNCATGITTARVQAAVGRVVDDRSFFRRGRVLPLDWRYGHLYRGWNLVWLSGAKPMSTSVIERFDPDTLLFRLTKPHEMKEGDRFEVYAPSANWNIHDNTIKGCQRPVVLDSYGSRTSLFRNNIITRGRAKDVKQAVVVAGRFNLIGNHISGFDEDGSAALVVSPDRLGKANKNVITGNVFENCACAVDEARPGLWKSCITSGNVFIGCGKEIETGATGSQSAPGAFFGGTRLVMHAPKPAGKITVDGKLDEWPLNDKARVGILKWSPTGEPVASPQAVACAACDGRDLYLAVRISVGEKAKLVAGLGWQGDGIEVSFREAGGKKPAPTFMLWGTVDGRFNSTTQEGASPAQVKLLEDSVSYAARVEKDGWACEWRIPLSKLGIDPGKVKTLQFNLGVRRTTPSCWIAWVPTGGRICDVASAGELRLEP